MTDTCENILHSCQWIVFLFLESFFFLGNQRTTKDKEMKEEYKMMFLKKLKFDILKYELNLESY